MTPRSMAQTQQQPSTASSRPNSLMVGRFFQPPSGTPLLQRHPDPQTTHQAESSQAPPIVHEVLNAPGQPLDRNTRHFMESRFGHDFSHVRVHTDADAAHSAHAVNAQAYTVGNHIVFNNGQYAPTSAIGRHLLTHELTHVVQQGMDSHQPQPTKGLTLAPPNSSAEREADAWAGNMARTPFSLAAAVATPPPFRTASSGQLYRQVPGGAGIPAAPPTMTRQTFETTMQQRFGVQDIHNGTFAEQAAALTRHNLPPADADLRPLWQPWDPGASTSFYQNIVDAFDRFQQQFGAVPPVTRILFFDMHYERDPQTGALTPNPRTGADFGVTTMQIYQAATINNLGLPMGRSSTTPPANPPIAAISGRGATPGAPIPLPSRQESEIRTITHELGHGVAQAAHQANPNIFNEYRLAVGWTTSYPPQLFDIGVTAVQTALQNNTTPPPQYEITIDNWNNPQWIEQPITGYMVSDPGEDFADAIMTYINDRPLLQSRSPRRFQFIDTRRSQWLPFMQQQASTQPQSQPQPQPRPQPPRRRGFRPRTDFNDRLIRDIENL